jgi:hypothetical protein
MAQFSSCQQLDIHKNDLLTTSLKTTRPDMHSKDGPRHDHFTIKNRQRFLTAGISDLLSQCFAAHIQNLSYKSSFFSA